MNPTQGQIQIIKDHMVNMIKFRNGKQLSRVQKNIRKEVELCILWLRNNDTAENRMVFELEQHSDHARLNLVKDFIGI
jgi:hypothetical protein